MVSLKSAKLDRFFQCPDTVPSNVLSLNDPEELCWWLCRCVLKTHKEDGSRYPPPSIRQLSGAFQYILRVEKVPYNILDKLDVHFEIFNLTVNTVCVSLRKEGIGADVKHARVLTLEDEATLWQTGVLGIDTPKILRSTSSIFCY